MINPQDAMTSLMTKWIIKAMEPGNSNLHLLLRFRLSMYQPYSGGRWTKGLEYFTLSKHQCRRGSIVWNRINVAWKNIRGEVSFIRPNNLEELLSCSLWFCPSYSILGPGFSKQRATFLHKQGMRYYRDVWSQTRFLDPMELHEKFGLLHEEFGAWVRIT